MRKLNFLLFILLASISAPVLSQTTTLNFSTYFGGNNFEHIRDLEFDAQGNIYVVGGSESTNLPTTPGVIQPTHNNGPADTTAIDLFDVFIAKFTPTGALIWSTYLGGPNYERGYSIEVDSQGYVYIAGRAGRGFPTTAGSFQPTFSGSTKAPLPPGFYGEMDGFVCKINPTATAVVFCSYFGTDDVAIIRDLDIDSQGNIYVSAKKYIAASNFPAAIQTKFTNTPKGGDDAVIAKIAANGASVLWATYLGGSGTEENESTVQVDGSDNPTMIFTTDSSNITAPAGFDQSYNGSGDIYAVRLNPTTGAVVWGTYVGTAGNESTEKNEMAVDPAGNVYIAAPTTAGTTFPSTAGAYRSPNLGGGNDTFVMKISNTGTLLATALIGGADNDRGEGIDIAPNGDLCFGGITRSTNFVTTAGALRSTLSGAGTSDGFFVRMPADLSQLTYATYFGGAGTDQVRAVSSGPSGACAIAGETQSTSGFPLSNAAYSSFAGGTTDAYLAKFTTSGATDTIPPSPPTGLTIQ